MFHNYRIIINDYVLVVRGGISQFPWERVPDSSWSHCSRNTEHLSLDFLTTHNDSDDRNFAFIRHNNQQ